LPTSFPARPRLIEVDKDDLVDLAGHRRHWSRSTEKIRHFSFCDDLAFEAARPAYKACEIGARRSLCRGPPVIRVIYATVNRRLLIRRISRKPRHHARRRRNPPGEAIEDKISLSERFGLWISFYPFSQDDYLAVALHWLREFGVADA
jgi:predicted AAA+ superfamily ATPase